MARRVGGITPGCEEEGLWGRSGIRSPVRRPSRHRFPGRGLVEGWLVCYRRTGQALGGRWGSLQPGGLTCDPLAEYWAVGEVDWGGVWVLPVLVLQVPLKYVLRRGHGRSTLLFLFIFLGVMVISFVLRSFTLPFPFFCSSVAIVLYCHVSAVLPCVAHVVYVDLFFTVFIARRLSCALCCACICREVCLIFAVPIATRRPSVVSTGCPLGPRAHIRILVRLGGPLPSRFAVFA